MPAAPRRRSGLRSFAAEGSLRVFGTRKDSGLLRRKQGPQGSPPKATWTAYFPGSFLGQAPLGRLLVRRQLLVSARCKTPPRDPVLSSWPSDRQFDAQASEQKERTKRLKTMKTKAGVHPVHGRGDSRQLEVNTPQPLASGKLRCCPCRDRIPQSDHPMGMVSN